MKVAAMRITIPIGFLTGLLILAAPAQAQVEESIVSRCMELLEHPYVSDGQQYKALLQGEEVAEFESLFYGGSTYRLVACSNNITFKLFDEERNELFKSIDYGNSKYWDFEFKSTMRCWIEAQLDSEKGEESGFAIMLIGFKQ